MEGEAYLIRYIDDFIVCFRYGRDGERFQAVLSRRLNTFHLALESTKTRLIAFGRGLLSETSSTGGEAGDPVFPRVHPLLHPEPTGGFMLGRKTEKSRVRRTIQRLPARTREIRHDRVEDQVRWINQLLQGLLGVLWYGRELAAVVPGLPGRDALLASHAESSQSKESGHLESVPANP